MYEATCNSDNNFTGTINYFNQYNRYSPIPPRCVGTPQDTCVKNNNWGVDYCYEENISNT